MGSRILAFIAGAFVALSLAAATSGSINYAQVSTQVNGVPQFLGTITNTAGTPKDNTNTAVTFTITPPVVLMVQCDAAAFIGPGIASGSLVDASAPIQLQAKQTWFFTFQTQSVLSIDSAVSTANCKVSSMF